MKRRDSEQKIKNSYDRIVKESKQQIRGDFEKKSVAAVMREMRKGSEKT